jgi:hypothetical protein
MNSLKDDHTLIHYNIGAETMIDFVVVVAGGQALKIA